MERRGITPNDELKVLESCRGLFWRSFIRSLFSVCGLLIEVLVWRRAFVNTAQRNIRAEAIKCNVATDPGEMTL